MQRLTILLLATSLALIGCKPARVSLSQTRHIVNSYFSNPAKDYVYRTTINVYGNDLSGILIAKKINDSVHRAVLTTDFGNTLLDMEIGPDAVLVNSIVQDLDRKIIVKTLGDDFRMLFREQYLVVHDSVASGKDTLIYKSIEGKTPYTLRLTKGRLCSILRGKSKKPKVMIEFTSRNDTFAEQVLIEHFAVRLKIRMHHLNQ